ncbi:hypothetical protein SHL15_6705 [Streptomyces hygroscopicus subsp. limoneus]|nr:hypothetical protein SHL15_6705 [Streptomyces hygroscopicus subsp. limoneus]
MCVEPPVFTTAAAEFLDNASREFLTVLDQAPPLLDQCCPATSAWPQDAEVLAQLAAALLTAQQVRGNLNNGLPLACSKHHAQTWSAIETWLAHGHQFLRQARAAFPRPRPTAVLPQLPRRLPPGQALRG